MYSCGYNFRLPWSWKKFLVFVQTLNSKYWNKLPRSIKLRGSLPASFHFIAMAEREGFEPSVPLLVAHAISSRAPSASSDISPLWILALRYDNPV